jgi:hypothetical protein
MAYEDADGKVVYRASSLGSCIGALVRARLGVSGSAPSDMMQERFDEGHAWEERVITAGLGVDFTRVTDRDHLELYGKVVESDSGLQVETELAWSNKIVRCHPDAIAIQGSTLKPYVVEAKFLGEQMFNDITMRGVWPVTYQWQKAVEMLSTGLPLLYIIGKKVVEEDAAGERMVSLGEVWTEEILTPPMSLAEVKMRVLEVEGYVTRGEMPACPVPLMYPCPYWADHEPAESTRVDESDDEVLKAWVDVWKLAKAASEKADADLEFARKAVAEQIKELGLASARCDGVDITTVTPTQGNVSWAKAYKALSQQTGERVDEDKFRGKVGDATVRIAYVKDKAKEDAVDG